MRLLELASTQGLAIPAAKGHLGHHSSSLSGSLAVRGCLVVAEILFYDALLLLLRVDLLLGVERCLTLLSRPETFFLGCRRGVVETIGSPLSLL